MIWKDPDMKLRWSIERSLILFLAGINKRGMREK